MSKHDYLKQINKSYISLRGRRSKGKGEGIRAPFPFSLARPTPSHVPMPHWVIIHRILHYYLTVKDETVKSLGARLLLMFPVAMDSQVNNICADCTTHLSLYKSMKNSQKHFGNAANVIWGWKYQSCSQTTFSVS